MGNENSSTAERTAAPDILKLESAQSRAEAVCEGVEELSLATVDAMLRPSQHANEQREDARSRLKAACLVLLRPMLRAIDGGRSA